LRHLPKIGERPFVAALPQAALRNPEGPLCVIGHIDIAWSSSYSQGDGAFRRIYDPVKMLVNGESVGEALRSVVNAYHIANGRLVALYKDKGDVTKVAQEWMLRNDLRAYVLLGDPAARLCVAG
jgi:hypothetical protein